MEDEMITIAVRMRKSNFDLLLKDQSKGVHVGNGFVGLRRETETSDPDDVYVLMIPASEIAHQDGFVGRGK